MFATFSQRVRICIALIERFGIKRMLIATREVYIRQKTGTENVVPTPAFRRYQVFR